MKSLKSFSIVLFTALLIATLQVAALGQTASQEAKDTGLANVSSAGSSVRWDLRTSYSGATLTIAAPDGRVFRKELKAGATPEFTTLDKEGNRLPDGQYTYELRLTPVLSKVAMETLVSARGRDDEAEAVRATRKRPVLPDQSLVQSGNFSILNGAIFVPGPVEEAGSRPTSKITGQPRLTGAPAAALAKIRPETGTIVFEVDAGAPANSLKVSSTGRVGLRTATPVLDLHITTGDTPAHRLEQTNASGFTAQTWDVAGNEANFFVRDVTGGSRPPFRIRPGAPTSSVDISGSVGVGTASPTFALDVLQNANNSTTGTVIRLKGNSAGANDNTQIRFTGKTNGDLFTIGTDITTNNGTRNFQLFDLVSAAARVSIDATGRVGIGTTAPTDTLSVNGTASKPGGGSWAVFSDERLKNIKGHFNSGLKAVMQLQPLRYEYNPNNALKISSDGEHIGFGAQALQKIIPEAVTRNSQGYLMVNNDPILWTMLNAIQEQQKEMVELKKQVRQLRTAARRRK